MAGLKESIAGMWRRGTSAISSMRTANRDADETLAGKPKAKEPFLSLKSAKDDGLAGFINAIANIPGEMGSAVLAGVNPIYAMNTLFIGLPVAALFTSTHMLMFDTTSAMTLVAADGLGSRTGDTRANALIVIALTAGIFQIAMGVLGLGQLTKFVPNSVMTGFLTGIAITMVLGQLWDLTGYDGTSTGSRLAKTAELVGNLSDVDLASTVIGVGSLVAMFWIGRTKLANFNLLIALVGALVVAWVFRWIGWNSVALVNSEGEIPRSIPLPHLPELRLIPDMLLAGVAVGAVGLIQGAGVAQRYPNADGSASDDSRDFLAQGVANVACGLFRGMPGGGSLSGTALNVETGARTRMSLIFQAVIALGLVLVFSDLLGQIPMPALAALLIYVGILAVKLPAISSIMATNRSSQLSLMVTFIATLLIPLQQAVILGVILAAVLFLYRSSMDIRIRRVEPLNGRYRETDAPETLMSNSVTVLDIYGSLFYAGARTIGHSLPRPGDAHRAVVIMRLRGHGDIGSTFLDVIGKYADALRKSDGRLMLSGLDPKVKKRMARTGHLDRIGDENIFVAGEYIGESTAAAFNAGQHWLEVTEAMPKPPTPDGGSAPSQSSDPKPNDRGDSTNSPPAASGL
jgi:SulP family sulfate permease